MYYEDADYDGPSTDPQTVAHDEQVVAGAGKGRDESVDFECEGLTELLSDAESVQDMLDHACQE